MIPIMDLVERMAFCLDKGVRRRCLVTIVGSDE